MSHANGEVIKDGKVVGYYEYNGTCDVAISYVYDTSEEMEKNWRSGTWTDCSCGTEPEPVLLYTDYGNGFYWDSSVCFKCRAITGRRDPFEIEDKMWWDESGYNGPTDGHPLKGS